MMAHVITHADLPHSGSATSHRFDGHLFGDVRVSFFLTDAPPGTGTRLHRHPYAEVFVVQEGNVTFTVGDETIHATAGQIVNAPADRPHKFVNTGPGRSCHLDIHANERMVTEWLEDEQPGDGAAGSGQAPTRPYTAAPPSPIPPQGGTDCETRLTHQRLLLACRTGSRRPHDRRDRRGGRGGRV
jgi:quercetin dioxygenase-like cupin family protein